MLTRASLARAYRPPRYLAPEADRSGGQLGSSPSVRAPKCWGMFLGLPGRVSKGLRPKVCGIVPLMIEPNPTARLRMITGTSAIVAGLAWVAKDIGSRVSSDSGYWDCKSPYGYLLNGIDTVAFLVLGLALFGLHKIFRSAMGERRAVIGLVAAAGFGVAGLANLLEHCAGLDALGLAYVIGLLLGMLPLVAFGVMLRRVGLPSWCTWFLVLGTVLGVLFAEQGGLIAFGLSWFAFGLVIRKSSSMPQSLDPHIEEREPADYEQAVARHAP